VPDNKDKLKLYIDNKSIARKVNELAARISKDYKGKVPIFIGVLNGSFIFLSDLLRKVDLNMEVDFLKLSSYGDNKISTGNIRLLKDLNCPIADRDILVVEDIVDSGLSLSFIRSLIANHKPNSLEFVSLLYKRKNANIDFDIKYVGFKIPDKFVVGYGLDYAQKYRNLRSIYILKN
jgi:hypoxanthine phosphoribosyltransferase